MVDTSRRASGLVRPSGRHSAGPNGPVVTGPATGLTHGSYARGDPQTPLISEPNVFSIDNSSIGESGAQTHICAYPERRQRAAAPSGSRLLHAISHPSL